MTDATVSELIKGAQATLVAAHRMAAPVGAASAAIARSASWACQQDKPHTTRAGFLPSVEMTKGSTVETTKGSAVKMTRPTVARNECGDAQRTSAMTTQNGRRQAAGRTALRGGQQGRARSLRRS